MTTSNEKVVPLNADTVTYIKVPTAVVQATLDVFNQLPRGQINTLAMALEQCVKDDVSDG